MTKSELKQLIRETIEAVQAEAIEKSRTRPTYTFDQLNKLLHDDKIRVFIKYEYSGQLIQIDEDEGFFMHDNDDGENSVHVSDGINTLYEFGRDFEEVYVATPSNDQLKPRRIKLK